MLSENKIIYSQTGQNSLEKKSNLYLNITAFRIRGVDQQQNVCISQTQIIIDILTN